jgi:hypothetical protein
MGSRFKVISASAAACALAAFLTFCSSAKQVQDTAQMGTLVIHVNNSAIKQSATTDVAFGSAATTCTTASGATYSHVFVTVTDVLVHESASAGAGDAGWVDLWPSGQAAKQIDLMNTSQTSCLLTTLVNQTLSAGHYQQLRIILGQTTTGYNLAKNNCTVSTTPGPSNCVVLSDGTVKPLQLASEAQTGLKINLAPLLGGGPLNVQPGQQVDLNLEFDPCGQITETGSGAFILNPVISKAEVAANMSCGS